MSDTLPLLCFYDGGDYVIAHSVEDASTVWEETAGAPHEDSEYEWETIPPEREIPIYDENANATTTKTAAEWCVSNGRGFLCSENW